MSQRAVDFLSDTQYACDLLPVYAETDAIDKKVRAVYGEGAVVALCADGGMLIATSLVANNTTSPITGSLAANPTWRLQTFAEIVTLVNGLVKSCGK